MADEDTTGTEQATEPDDQTGDQPLGEGGIKALQAERKARQDAERQLRETNQRLADVEAAQVRAEVARAKGLTDAQAKRLTGDSREELEADADELLEAFGNRRTGDAGNRPKERLRPGASNPDERADPDAIAERIIGR